MVQKKRRLDNDATQTLAKRPHVDEEIAHDEPDALDEGEGSAEGDWTGFDEGVHGQDDAKEGRPITRMNGATSSRDARPPTRAELRAIREAAALFGSAALKLQIDALLPKMRPRASRTPPLDAFLLRLHAALSALPKRSPAPPLTAARALEKQSPGVSVPFCLPVPTEDVAWSLSCAPPSEITLVGSWPTKTSVRCPGDVRWVVDVAVEMPEELFQEKDYLDGRFFNKRAFYLACAAAHLQADKTLNAELRYDAAEGDSRMTTLILRHREDNSDTDFSKLQAAVRILPVLPSPSPIALHHLSTAHHNLRIKSAETVEAACTVPTPLYNTALLLHTTSRTHLLQTHALTQDVPAARDALALLRVWATQRGFVPGGATRECVLGFSARGYLWPTLLRALVDGEEDVHGASKVGSGKRPVWKSLSRGLSSYQLFRGALDFLSKRDFVEEPFFMKGGTRYAPETYAASESAIFVDSSSVNLMAGVPLASLDFLRHCAKTTLDMLNTKADSAEEAFSETFLTDCRQLSVHFDIVLNVDLRKAVIRKRSPIEVLDCGSTARYALHTLASVIRRALGDRVHAIAIFTPACADRPISQSDLAHPLQAVHIGLILDTANAFRLVDHGPAAAEEGTESADVLAFRDFWGPKAELRRFKDGRILESVVWEAVTPEARALVPAAVVRAALTRHLGLEGARDVRGVQAEFDALLRAAGAFSRRLLPVTQPGFRSALAAFDAVVRQVKELDDDVPLAVLNVSPASAQMRYTSVFTPVPISPKQRASLPGSMTYLPSMEILLQFERSSRWPDDFRMAQKMKLVFFERIGSALMNKVSGLKASIVMDPGADSASSYADRAYLEIVTPEGWAFTARIWYERDPMLLERLVEKKRPGVVRIANTKQHQSEDDKAEKAERRLALEAQQFYLRHYVHAPAHHRAVTNLCHKYAAYAGTVRLVKRWLGAHWLYEGHVRSEAIELLCAGVFLGSTARSAPATKESGFARVVAFLKDWAWEAGLPVPLYELDAEDAAEPQSETIPIKAGMGRGVWTISTGKDQEGRVWTLDGPSALVARRIRALAGSCARHVVAHERAELTPKALFLHPSDDYDILIKLRAEALCRRHQRIDAEDADLRSKYANLVDGAGDNDGPLRVDFDPALMYFRDLQSVFSGTLEFFFNQFGGSIIGAVWDPNLLVSRPFRVLAEYSAMPSSNEGDAKQKVVLNQAAVLAEIQRLGEGLVESIEVRSRQ